MKIAIGELSSDSETEKLLHAVLPQQICKGFQLIVRIEIDGQLAFAVVVGHATGSFAGFASFLHKASA